MKVYLFLSFLFFVVKPKENSTNNNTEEDSPELNDVSFDPQKDNITILEDKNYINELKKSNFSILLLYASWCGHCKIFKPIYIELANEYKNKNLSISFFAIEASSNQQAADDFNVDQFPTMYIIINQTRHLYTYSYNKESFNSYINKKLNGSIKYFEKVDEINEYKKNLEFSVLLTFPKNSSNFRTYVEIAENSEFNEYLYCASEECLKTFGENLYLFKNFDENFVKLSEFKKNISHFSSRDLFDFVKIYGIEIAGDFDDKGVTMLFDNRVNGILYFRDENNETQVKFDSELKKFAKDYRNSFYFFHVGLNKTNNYKKAKIFFDINDDEVPIIILFEQKRNKQLIYKMKNKEINLNNLKQFIEDFNNSKLISELRSEPPIPEKGQEFGFRIFVGKTFEKEFLNDTKNVGIMLYLTENENCAQCYPASEIFQELGKSAKEQNKNIVFGVINLDRNDVKGLNITKYPKIILYPLINGKKSIENNLIYNLTLNETTLNNWIKENTGIEISINKKETKQKNNNENENNDKNDKNDKNEKNDNNKKIDNEDL